MTTEDGIKITEDGPYWVLGTPVAAARIVKTERGEPVEWDVDEPYETGRVAVLCRCGRSKTKPFCDDSHLEGFEGAEVADRGSTDDRRQSFPGGGLTLTDDGSICSHAGFCRDYTSTAWDRMDEIADPEVRAKEEAIVFRCPSGRLVLLDEDDAPIEAPFEPSVAVERDGPYWVRGGVRVESSDGHVWETRNRVTLCRCGQSSNKPFCDGTHEQIDFQG